MKSLKAVRSKFVVAFMVDKMDIPSRFSLLFATAGLGCQFLSTLLGGVNHFVGSSVIPHVEAILSITSGVFILILCWVVVEGFILRNYLVKRRTAKKSALQSSGSI
ncbi:MULTISPECIES: hypothetical protein [Vibrio]|uniref:hypothetical protein n=1 Tax=Vibrio TaxID=662 RepID=UPI001B83513F|nr:MULTISPECIES: hypothetical protein [Vibrio]BDP38370.1 hypothetical protein VA208B3_47410 [Vibrio alginolyticus]MDF5646594.1 hypothetical protein [Vibrio parahaemolyticus]MDF5666148.1 hypothetical protein [Vibrio parahaemolyticus]WKV19400.1 hypothetical protein [Vibrio parahaemolyticus]BDP33386.1 hypothetical protein VV208B2_44660 [Vibrio vulnificus]